MSSFAENTTVSVSRSQGHIQETLRRYGADQFGVMEGMGRASVMFVYSGLSVRISVDIPRREDYSETETGRERKEASADKVHQQAVKQRWRCLLLAIKAKLESVESGISTIEQEFMAWVVMPDGTTLGERLLPHLRQIASTGELPKLLPQLPQVPSTGELPKQVPA